MRSLRDGIEPASGAEGSSPLGVMRTSSASACQDSKRDPHCERAYETLHSDALRLPAFATQVPSCARKFSTRAGDALAGQE
eukprot:2278999-Pleurochrysis_carterae.AAC.1